MAPTADGDDRARLFVALELPAPLAEAILAWRAPLLAAHEWLRPVQAGTLHVTLCFLGDRPVSAIDEIVGLGETTVRASQRGSLGVGAPVWLPRRRPRVLAVELDDGDGWLGALQGRMATTLAQAGLYHAERPRFLAHVTVARVRRSAPHRPPQELGLPQAVRADGAIVSLMRSVLGRGPARYERLARWDVPGGHLAAPQGARIPGAGAPSEPH